jgi:prepilin-type processing-associated H-X9-DG protein
MTGASNAGAANAAVCVGPNWAAALLTYLEEQALGENLRNCVKDPNTANACSDCAFGTVGDKYGNIGRQTLDQFTCPTAPTPTVVLVAGTTNLTGDVGDARFSRNMYMQGGALGKGNYVANFGISTYIPAPESVTVPATPVPKTISTRGAFQVEDLAVLSNQPAATTTALGKAFPNKMASQYGQRPIDFRDGLSKTVTVSETYGTDRQNDARGVWALGAAGASVFTGGTERFGIPSTNTDFNATGSGALSTYLGPNWAFGPTKTPARTEVSPACDTGANATLPTVNPLRCSAGNDVSTYAAAKSLHNSGVNVAMADGSSKFIQDDILPKVWRAMLTRAGGVGESQDPMP